jgi:hypothetical protein
MEVILMPRKPKAKSKATAKEPAITVRSAPPPVAPIVTRIPIRCIWDSRLIIGNDKTPTGEGYEFETDQIKKVNEDDYQFLLEMETRPYGCCGGTIRPQKYFEEV